MKISNIKYKLKHQISTMVICGSYMFEANVSKHMRKNDVIREVAVGNVVAHLCLTLVVKKPKISVEQGRVVTTLNIIKH